MSTQEMRKVLVVDDEEVVRVSHMRTLAGENCKVEAARGGEQAVENMQREPADVVLMDLRMPGVDGLAALKTIKERWPDTEVVIITGYPSVHTAREAVRLGAFDYLAKPVEPDKVPAVATEATAQRLAPPPGKKRRTRIPKKGGRNIWIDRIGAKSKAAAHSGIESGACTQAAAARNAARPRSTSGLRYIASGICASAEARNSPGPSP